VLYARIDAIALENAQQHEAVLQGLAELKQIIKAV
jgi:hypothetical protein